MRRNLYLAALLIRLGIITLCIWAFPEYRITFFIVFAWSSIEGGMAMAIQDVLKQREERNSVYYVNCTPIVWHHLKPILEVKAIEYEIASEDDFMVQIDIVDQKNIEFVHFMSAEIAYNLTHTGGSIL